MPGNAFTPMSRSTLLILRVLAVGGALTVLACHVVRRQQEATAGAAGDRGTTGSNAPPPVRISGTKSLGPAPGRQPGAPESSQPVPVPNGQDTIIVGTKSAPVLNPADVKTFLTEPAPAPQPPVRPAIPSTKSARMITPAEVQRFQQQQAPAAQQSATPRP